MLTPREQELLHRRRLNYQLELRSLDAGELWHVLSDEEYRSLLLAGLEEIETELDEGVAPWRPDPGEFDNLKFLWEPDDESDEQ